ncbi:GDSL-like Lipase/Acylhydrolase [Nesidiocoris tenuis]|uniref:GDSL-like Lipase/Acylhydrolase n=1 Tax=Nesidiocoris tenuis TaxID=355587 RepID=A0ABN7AUC6_9HEMI|nr:GDSL-like Lipase/Acylhydrolase [Nesidiocoris tenuis]
MKMRPSKLLLPVVVLVLVNLDEGCARKRGKTPRSSKRAYTPLNVASALDQRWLRDQGYSDNRKQGAIPKDVPFPCYLPRSSQRPNSVDRVRPADIDVVAAMGDSLIAGNGAMEDYALGTFIESRGVSWAAGGDRTWHEYLTVPNIIKLGNPKLKGFSQGKEYFLSPNAFNTFNALNVAFPVSADQDAITQAKTLVYKMNMTRGIDFKNDWKLVTMLFGANDVCSGQCFDKDQFSPAAHAYKLMRALDYLQDNMPRAIVNLVPVLDVSVSVRVRRSLVCRMLHRLFCACFHRDSGDVMSSIIKISRQYQKHEQLLISSGRYNVKKDFTVVIQPFMTSFNAPRNITERGKEVIPPSYITYDCFHFSQKGHALAANLLWNNMLEPVGEKSTTKMDYPLQQLYCPTEENPFIFTYNNSNRFYLTGSQLG